MQRDCCSLKLADGQAPACNIPVASPGALPIFLALQHPQLAEGYSPVLQIVAPPAGSSPTVSDAVIDLLSFPTADAANTSQGQLSDAVQQGRFDQASLQQ